MRHHDRPAEVGLDREIPERRLRQRPGEERDRELLCPAPQRGPQRCQGDQQRDQDRHPADDPVSELDVSVVVLRRQGMARFAPGPVPAAQARAGQSHRRACRHDHPEREELERREPEKPGRRQRKRARPAGGGRLDLHRKSAYPGSNLNVRV